MELFNICTIATSLGYTCPPSDGAVCARGWLEDGTTYNRGVGYITTEAEI